MPADSHRTSSNGGTQCLLLTPRGRQTPAELLDGLRQRGVDVCEVNDPPAVMVALTRRGIATVVIVEPGVWARLADLMQAIRKFHPAVALWQYAADAQPRLRHCPSPEAQPAATRAARQEPLPSAAAPAVDARRVDVRPSQREIFAPDELRLTEEELAMLLGDDEPGTAGASPS